MVHLPGPHERIGLCIAIEGCHDLIDTRKTSLDPYVQVRLGDKYLHQTKFIKKTRDPMYKLANHSNFYLECLGEELFDADGLRFIVKDADALAADECIGEAKLSFEMCWSMKGEIVEKKLIKEKKGTLGLGRKIKTEVGFITLNCRRGSKEDKDMWDSLPKHKCAFFQAKPSMRCLQTQKSILPKSCNPHYKLRLIIKMVLCNDMNSSDVSQCNPYVEISWGGKVIHKTKYIPKTTNPVFRSNANPIFCLECTVEELKKVGGLSFDVKNYHSISRDEELGILTVSADDICDAEGYRTPYKLGPPRDHAAAADKNAGEKKKEEEEYGTLTMSIEPATPADIEKYGILTPKNATKKGMFSHLLSQTELASPEEDYIADESDNHHISSLFFEPIKAWELVAMDMAHKSPTFFKAKIQAKTVNSVRESLLTAMKNFPDIWWVEFNRLEVAKTADDVLFASELQKCRYVRKVRLIDLTVVSHIAQVPDILEAVMQMPKLEELEISMQFMGRLPDKFILSLANSSLKRLVICNVVFDTDNLKSFFKALEKNRILKVLEIMSSSTSVGTTIAELASKMLQKNKSIQRVVLADVGLREEGVAALSVNLKGNTCLQEMALIGVSDAHKESVAKHFIKCTKSSRSLKNLQITYSILSHSDAQNVYEHLYRNYAVKKYRHALASLSNDKSCCFCG